MLLTLRACADRILYQEANDKSRIVPALHLSTVRGTASSENKRSGLEFRWHGA